MKAPQGLLRELETAGITLTLLEGDRLIARPSERVTPEIKEALRESKPQIIRALRGEEVPQAPPSEDTPPDPLELARAEALGLVARWSKEFGYVSVHDPTSGTWHDLPTKDAPSWARNEAFLRKRLAREQGITRMLNAREITAEWKQSVPDMPTFGYAKEGRRPGLIYDDQEDLEGSE